MTNETSQAVLAKINRLKMENTQSVLKFDAEYQEAEVLTKQQKHELEQMTKTHKQIKEVASSQVRVTTDELQALKDQFTTHYTAYQQNETQLNTLYTKLETAYEIENKIMKEYLLAESTKMLESLVGKLAAQDEKIQQLEQAVQEQEEAVQEQEEVAQEQEPQEPQEPQTDGQEVTTSEVHSTVGHTAVEELSNHVVEPSEITEEVSVQKNVEDTILEAQEIFFSESTNSTL